MNRWGDAFPRDEAVVDELRRDGMIRDTAPLAYRQDELRWLQSVYGLSDVFGDEAPGIVAELMEEANGAAPSTTP